MSYTILKLHANRLLKFKDMDPITDFLQYKLYKNFGYSDNFVIKSLENSLIELRAKRLDLPPAADENELPKCEFGEFVEPTIEKKLGLRSALSNSERNVTEFVITRNEELAQNEDEDENTHTDDGYSQHFSTGNWKTTLLLESCSTDCLVRMALIDIFPKLHSLDVIIDFLPPFHHLSPFA